MDLGKKYSKKSTIPGVLRNTQDLRNLLDKNNISIVCSEKEYDWERTLAHASVSSENKILDPPTKHPFISISPNASNRVASLNKEENYKLKKTIFHEQLHNLGYRHGGDIEYSYACEDCCFSNDEKEKTTACKICTGDYTNSTDIRYIEDLFAYSKVKYSNTVFKIGIKAAISYLKENPKNIEGISLLASALSADYFNPIGSQLAATVIKKK